MLILAESAFRLVPGRGEAKKKQYDLIVVLIIDAFYIHLLLVVTQMGKARKVTRRIIISHCQHHKILNFPHVNCS